MDPENIVEVWRLPRIFLRSGINKWKGQEMTTNPAPVVLVIDDNTDNREMYSFTLTNSGFEVLQAGDGVEALALASARLPMVVVTDLRMPGAISAVDICRQFRSLDVPVIALTAVGPGEEHDAMQRAGCAAVLMKPLSPDQLLAEINRVLAPRGSRAVAHLREAE
jgi:CheY-like chemotaxis protein